MTNVDVVLDFSDMVQVLELVQNHCLRISKNGFFVLVVYTTSRIGRSAAVMFADVRGWRRLRRQMLDGNDDDNISGICCIFSVAYSTQCASHPTNTLISIQWNRTHMVVDNLIGFDRSFLSFCFS